MPKGPQRSKLMQAPRTPRVKQSYETEHGTAQVTPGGYIFNFGIKPESQGQGHGSALLRQITSDADQAGTTLKLHARDELHPWYGREGFTLDASPGAKLEQDIFGQPMMVREPRRDAGHKSR